MTSAVRLADLGDRICILGQSGGGKSTLAAAIGAARGHRVVHLDRLRHLPGTQWRLRPDEELAALHADAIAGDRWVIDGNYSALLAPRLARATGLILVEASIATSLARYARRTLRPSHRIGGLEGTVDRLSASMIDYQLRHTRANRRRRRALLDDVALPAIVLTGPRATERFVDAEDLPRLWRRPRR